jgi:hypothetical protein
MKVPTEQPRFVSPGMSFADARDAVPVLPPGRVPEFARRRVYIAPELVRPSVDWWCLLRKGSGCIARCGTNISCYVRCAPEAVECFDN